MTRMCWMFVVAALLVAPSSVAAQEDRKAGLVMGLPQVGFLWLVSDRVAIRPDVNLSWSGTDDDDVDADSHSVGAGVSALFYVARWDDLRAYVVPRYGFQRSSATTISGGSAVGDTIGKTHQFSGAFGAEYRFGSRFSAFGEAGFSYQRSRSEYPENPVFLREERTSHGFGSRTGVGVVFYF